MIIFTVFGVFILADFCCHNMATICVLLVTGPLITILFWIDECDEELEKDVKHHQKREECLRKVIVPLRQRLQMERHDVWIQDDCQKVDQSHGKLPRNEVLWVRIYHELCKPFVEGLSFLNHIILLLFKAILLYSSIAHFKDDNDNLKSLPVCNRSSSCIKAIMQVFIVGNQSLLCLKITKLVLTFRETAPSVKWCVLLLINPAPSNRLAWFIYVCIRCSSLHIEDFSVERFLFQDTLIHSFKYCGLFLPYRFALDENWILWASA